MYANPSLIEHAMCTSLPKVNLYITVLRGDFWKYLYGEFVFHVTIQIRYSFIVCRILFLQEDVHLQSFTEHFLSLINSSEKNLSINSRYKTSPYTCTLKTYCIFDFCTEWIGHNLLISVISKLSNVYTQANIYGYVAKILPPSNI